MISDCGRHRASFDPFDKLPGTMPGTGRAGKQTPRDPFDKLRASSLGTGRTGRAWGMGHGAKN